jgi:hypothetical protein
MLFVSEVLVEIHEGDGDQNRHHQKNNERNRLKAGFDARVLV